MQIMLKQMCNTELNDSDIKAICKNRGFPAREAASRDIFENFFLSNIGIKEAISSLTYEEIVFLHLLNKINKDVDIEYFGRLYKHESGYGFRTFTQQYKETFNKVKNNLIRKGVLIFIETEGYTGSTRLERLRFRFPQEFADFLPPLIRASKFEESGDLKREILRDKLLEIIGKMQRQSPLSKEKSFTLSINDGNLSIGTDRFRVRHMLKWQQACWHASVETNIRMKDDEMTPVDVILYALSQLKEHEWIKPDALSVMLKIFTGVEKFNPEQICAAGWEWGCLVKLVADGKTYYRLPEDVMEDTTSPEHYLQVKPDGTAVLDLMTIPYSALEVMASVSMIKANNSKLEATPSLIKIGNAPETFRKNNIVKWLKEHSSGFRTAIDIAQERWGKHIIHDNLMIARVKDLSLKVQIVNSFADPKSLVSLPDDYIAFPCDQLMAIQKIVETSGHVIKKARTK